MSCDKPQRLGSSRSRASISRPWSAHASPAALIEREPTLVKSGNVHPELKLPGVLRFVELAL
jgi:hypothetical protein